MHPNTRRQLAGLPCKVDQGPSHLHGRDSSRLCTLHHPIM